MIIIVKVIPNSSKNVLEKIHDGIWKIRIRAPADKGKANDELIRFLAESLQISKSRIRIISGHTNRLKRIEIEDGEFLN